MVKSIFLQDGEEIFVDDEDYERVNRHVWFKRYSRDAVSIYTVYGDKREFVALTTFIQKGSFQKKKNGDFTKNNLTTNGTSLQWSRPSRKSSSIYKGVSWCKNKKKWRATIYSNKKNKSLGYFFNEWEAAKAYNNAVDKYWGGHGYKNIRDVDDRINKRQKPCKVKQRRKQSKSGFKGASPHKNGYISVIHIKNKAFYLGISKDKNKCALMFNKASYYLYGNDAVLNDVPITEELKAFISNWEIPDKIKALKEGASGEK